MLAIPRVIKNCFGFCVPYSVNELLNDSGRFDLSFLKGVLGKSSDVKSIYGLNHLGLHVEVCDAFANHSRLVKHLREGYGALLLSDFHAVTLYDFADNRFRAWDSNVGDLVIDKDLSDYCKYVLLRF